MDIKWKNRVLFVISLILCLGGWYLMSLSNFRVADAKDLIGTNTYLYDTFTNSLYTENVLDDMSQIDEKEITYEDIQNYRYTYGDLGDQLSDIQNQYQEKIDIVKNKEEIKRLEKERDVKIQDIIDNFSSDEVVKEKIIKEERQYIEDNKKLLKETTSSELKKLNGNYLYSFKDRKTGQLYTNVSGLTNKDSEQVTIDKLKKLGVGQLSQDTRLVELYQLDNSPENSLTTITSEFSGYYIVKKDSELGKQLIKNINDNEKFEKLSFIGLAILMTGLIVVYFYLKTPLTWKLSDKTPADILLSIILLNIIISLATVFYVVPYYYGTLYNLKNILAPALIGIIALGVSLIASKSLWALILDNKKQGSLNLLLKDSFTFKAYKKVISIYRKGSVGLKIFIILLILIFNISFIYLYQRSTYYGIVGYLVKIIVLSIIGLEVTMIVKYIKNIIRLLRQPKNILNKYQENMNSDFSLSSVDNELLALDQLVENSQQNSLQSERLKSELLTNVSHDLRTPLTSIITYSDLLTKNNLSKEDQAKYIDIIHKKSLRMKYLIDDLFEVTKMNNGDISLDKTEVNVEKLLQQVLSERSDEFQENDLKIIFNKLDEEILLLLDGEKIWRVFDNMFDNVLKYSMPNTRVYLKISEDEEVVYITLKNISKHQLNEEADDLVDRFKRGDSSRHTDGSGLGLSIINSIVILHGGSLKIVVDGDMFKLCIVLSKEK